MLRNMTKTSKDVVTFARHLRVSSNPAEKYLWSKIRRKQFLGLRFRRQVPFGPYVLDFLCIEKKLVIEIDGDSHYEQVVQDKDRERDVYLKQRGLTVLHFGHTQTLQNIIEILERIRIVLGLEHE